eukprot:GILK01001648.1.p1 GENE.GILK01001648.1~~GILK01001648.1.p1  ORF type:complete len:798 (-),score=157.36 GILK01001648.1:163-2418(-)
MAEMTLRDKIGQMTQIDSTILLKPGTLDIDYDKAGYALKNVKVGSVLNTPLSICNDPNTCKVGLTPAEMKTFIQQFQAYAMSNTPAIPLLYGLDSVHGANYLYGATLFPHNNGLAATFNPEFAAKSAAITAKDTRVAGIPWVFSPVLDVAIQPLWPRFYESFGEDPYLAGVMGAAYTQGMQGGSDRSNLTAPFTGAGCMKHFIGYSGPRNGKDRTDAWIPKHYLKQYFVPSFQAAVDAGMTTVMVNSASINGVPVHASKELLTDLLRTEMGFEGIVVTDWEDIKKLVSYHRLAANDEEAVLMAVEAGVDMSMVPLDTSFADILFNLVNSGRVTENRINESVKRILQLKIDLGLFEYPVVPPGGDELIQSVGSTEEVAVALETARRSITLLKNDNQHNGSPVLPLNWVTKDSTILVVGPAGDSLTNQCGGWTFHWQGAASNREFNGYPTARSIFTAMSESGKSNIVYKRGCDFDSCSENELADIAAMGMAADVIILAVGEAPESESVGNINDLTISDSQLRLYDTVAKLNKPIVTVLIESRPRVLGRIATGSAAILMAYLPCTEGGRAVSDVIFGDLNPSGKLPFTYPRSTGDIEVYYHKPWSTYSQGSSSPFHDPLFDFGFGLSYSNLGYSDISLSSSTMAEDSVTVSVTVTNYGPLPARETVLLFLRQHFRRYVTPEEKMLKRFSQVDLEVNQSTQVTFSLSAEDVKYWTPSDTCLKENGVYDILIADKQATFTLNLPASAPISPRQFLV